MERKLPLNSKLLLSLLFLFVCFNHTSAQFRTVYNIGSIGMTGTVIPIFSGPVVISGSSCLVLTNGVTTFDLPIDGYFSNPCKFVFEQAHELRLIAYPNPVINYLTIQTANRLQLLPDSNIQLQLLDIQGRLIKIFYTNFKELNLGYQISLSKLASGSYLIRAYTNNYIIQTLPILKAN